MQIKSRVVAARHTWQKLFHRHSIGIQLQIVPRENSSHATAQLARCAAAGNIGVQQTAPLRNIPESKSCGFQIFPEVSNRSREQFRAGGGTVGGEGGKLPLLAYLLGRPSPGGS